MELILKRQETSDEGTFGILQCEVPKFKVYTLELPYRNNEKGISCIPVGDYVCKLKISPKFGLCYEVTNVPNRSNILIHAGNWAGDVEKGYKSNVEGCILLGSRKGTLSRQKAVIDSKLAVQKLLNFTEKENFYLKIVEEFNG